MTSSAATPTELARFLAANKGDVSKTDKAINDYLQWRADYLPDARKKITKQACRWWGFLEDENGRSVRSLKNSSSRVVLALGGFHLCGNRCGSSSGSGSGSGSSRGSGGVQEEEEEEEEMAPPCGPEEIHVETTVAAMSVWLDECLARDSDEKITLLVDVRPKDDWPNPTPTNLLPMIRQLSSVFGAMNPERLEACIIFPMPWIVRAVWYIVKGFMDVKTASKMQFLAGSSYQDAPFPDGLSEFVDEKYLTKTSFYGGRGGVIASREDNDVVVAEVVEEVVAEVVAEVVEEQKEEEEEEEEEEVEEEVEVEEEEEEEQVKEEEKVEEREDYNIENDKGDDDDDDEGFGVIFV